MGKKKQDSLYSRYLTALWKKDFDALKHFVLNEGLDVNHMFMNGDSPLHISAERGDLETVSFLLSLKGSPDTKNRHGDTPLMLAITDLPVVMTLIHQGNAHVNLCDSQKRTALQLASGRGLVCVVKALIRVNAQVNMTDRWGRSALHVAITHMGSNASSLLQTKSFNYLKVVETLINARIKVNHADRNGATPFFLACNCGCVKLVQMLIDNGAQTDRPGRHKLTPLMLTAIKGHEDVCKLLIYDNCNPNAVHCQTKRSIVQIALEADRLPIVKLLVLGGAKVAGQTYLFSRSWKEPRVVPVLSEDEWMKEILSSPQTLKHLCRSRVRQSIGQGIVKKMEQIRYPQALKDYILLKDILGVHVEFEQ